MNKTFSIVHCLPILSFKQFLGLYTSYIECHRFFSGRPRWRQSICNRDFIRSIKQLFRFCVCLWFLRLKETDSLSPQTSKHYDILTYDLWVTFPTFCTLTALTKFHCFYFIVFFCVFYKFPCVMQTNHRPRARQR